MQGPHGSGKTLLARSRRALDSAAHTLARPIARAGWHLRDSASVTLTEALGATYIHSVADMLPPETPLAHRQDLGRRAPVERKPRQSISE